METKTKRKFGLSDLDIETQFVLGILALIWIFLK